MARGRMISRSLGSSRKFAALRDRAGKLGEFAQALYPLLVASSDDFGRMAGDAFTVKLAVFPSSPRKESEFAEALKAMHAVRIVHLYEEGGVQVLQIVDFEANQPGLSKRTRSKFPGPPVNFTDFRELPTQLNGIEQNRTEPIRSPENPGTAEVDDGHKDENRTVAKFVGRFCELYKRHRHGARYFIKREKHIPLVKALLKTYDAERLEKLAVILLTTDDPWIAETDKGLGILSTKASWLDGLLAEYEAAHGPITVAV